MQEAESPPASKRHIARFPNFIICMFYIDLLLINISGGTPGARGPSCIFIDVASFDFVYSSTTWLLLEFRLYKSNYPIYNRYSDVNTVICRINDILRNLNITVRICRLICTCCTHSIDLTCLKASKLCCS